ncbi:8627_t:CDS:2 [Entrophospora sp. SA101]|nr:8627_t:CDS:2 [Entrophospora sp. SA101]
MSETKEQTKPPTFEELKRFEFIKVLNTRTKKINLLGYLSTPPSSSSDDPTLQKHHAILLVEKSHFDNKELSNFTSQRINDWMLKDKNDIYHWYDGLLNKDEKLPDINMTLIWPATETHIKKYSHQKRYLIHETPQIYKNIIEPYIDSIPSSRIQWVYNILQKKKSLYLVAIVHRNDIHSLRDLNKSHIPLLKNLRKKILEFVPKKFVGVGADELRLFVHYLPSYYHFHIHITHLSSDTIPDGIAIGKAYLLDDIITNLELFSDEYYQKTILTYVIGENDLLFSKLNDVGARSLLVTNLERKYVFTGILPGDQRLQTNPTMDDDNEFVNPFNNLLTNDNNQDAQIEADTNVSDPGEDNYYRCLLLRTS